MEDEVHCGFCGWQGTSDDLVSGIPQGFGEEAGDNPEVLEWMFLDPEYPQCCPECGSLVSRDDLPPYIGKYQ